jgi:hypothetical protein
MFQKKTKRGKKPKQRESTARLAIRLATSE